MKMKVALYGGAFDPPHHGHINFVKSACEIIKPDEVLIIPTGNAPHKSTLTPFEVRLKLAQAAFPDYRVSDIENKHEISYTIDTLRELKPQYPEGTEFFLLIGSDMLMNFAQWKDYQQIFELCTVVAAARDRSEARIPQSKFSDSRTKWLDIPVVEVSSQQIRGKLSAERYTHSINTALMCSELSKKYRLSREMSEKVFTAGLLHDIMKEGSGEELRHMVLQSERGFGFNTGEPDPAEIDEPKLWHAIAGAKYARDEMDILDTEILNAIRFHTIGRPNMSLIEKIVYIADKVSPEREYDGIAELRGIVLSQPVAGDLSGLDLGVFIALKAGIRKTLRKNKLIPAYTLNAYNYYVPV